MQPQKSTSFLEILKNLFLFDKLGFVKLNFKNSYLFLFNNYLKLSNVEISILSFILIWNIEWFVVIEYYLNYWNYTKLIFPYRVPVLLNVILAYWLIVWGVSVWKRTQFGKFTRGDRRLWFKGFASFWVIEFATVVGVYLCILWLSWGPLPLLNRYFIIPKRSFMTELTLITYIVWLVFISRMTLKHQLLKFQYFIVLTILFAISYLIWRDILILYMRETMCLDKGSRWRYVKVTSLVYSISNSWWVNHFMGSNKDLFSYYQPLKSFIAANGKISPFDETTNNIEYHQYHWHNNLIHDSKNHTEATAVIGVKPSLYSKWLVNTNTYWIYSLVNLDNNLVDFFYVRKTGFLPKRISMWYMLVVIKIWHHFMLFIWWFFYLFRINIRKKNSYSLLSVCYFNVYCCFVLSLLIYLIQLLPIYENFFRFKPYVRLWFHNRSLIKDALAYNYRVLVGEFNFRSISDELEILTFNIIQPILKL